MIQSFFLRSHADIVENEFQRKKVRSEEILGKAPLRFLRPECIADRTRMDLMHYKGVLGIRGPFTEGKNFAFTEIQNPDTAHPVIADMLEAFVDSNFPLEMAQIRFRVGSGGAQGIWIDAANEDLKTLKDHPEWLVGFLMRGWVIEAGQKRKEFKLNSQGGVDFLNATPRAWLDSYNRDGDFVPLLSLMALFSQPGPEVNRALIVSGYELLENAGISNARWTEWGAGYGNLSQAFASYLGQSGCESSEIDEGAVECLKLNRERFFPQVEVNRRAAESIFQAKDSDLWIIDPPRSGFPELLARLNGLKNQPAYVLAYHCHEKGLGNDAKILSNSGYSLHNWMGIDAFPATSHAEVVSLWKNR